MAEPVECYSGAAYGERPIAFQWQGQRLEVIEVISRWRTPDGKGFRVSASGGQLFELFYQEPEGAWQIIPSKENESD